MNFIFAALLSVTLGADPDAEYLGKLMYRHQTERNYSAQQYQQDARNFLQKSDLERRATVYADNLRSQQLRSMSSGTPWMRIEQCAPPPYEPHKVYPQPWDKPPPVVQPPYQFYNPYYTPYSNPYQYHIWIR